MAEGRARPAWIASLAIHGVLVAAVAWWLAERSGPASVPATPVPLQLAMFQAPAPVELPAPAEPTPVQEASPPQAVPEPAPPVRRERIGGRLEEASPEGDDHGWSSSEPPPVERPEPKPIPVKPRAAKAAPPKPAAPAVEPAVEPARAQPVESAPAAEAPVAVQSPAPAPDPALEDGYRVRIRQAVDEHKHYPRMARRLGLDGRVVVAFTVEADGRLAGVRVVESSGSELLDEAALEAVRKAAPFPSFPAGIERRRWDFTLPLSFSLDS